MEMSPQKNFRLRLGYVTCALLVAFLGLAVRLAYVQAYQHPKWAALADRMEADCVTIEAERGLILDRRGRSLAASAHVPSIFINPRAVPAERRAEVAATLAQILKMDPNGLADLLARPKYFAWVKRKVSPAESEAVLARGTAGRRRPRRAEPLLSERHAALPRARRSRRRRQRARRPRGGGQRDPRRHARLGAGVQGRARPHDVRRASLERAGDGQPRRVPGRHDPPGGERAFADPHD